MRVLAQGKSNAVKLPGGKMQAGITRLALQMMEQRITATVLTELTQIPTPTLSQYCLGQRAISRRHYPILAIALGTNNLQGMAEDDECWVVDNEWSEENPLQLQRWHTRPHQYPHHLTPHQYETVDGRSHIRRL